MKMSKPSLLWKVQTDSLLKNIILHFENVVWGSSLHDSALKNKKEQRLKYEKVGKW